MSAVAALLARERFVVAGGLALLTLLAWVYIWAGAGMGMPALHMTQLALFPHLAPDAMADMAPPAFQWPIAIAMWG